MKIAIAYGLFEGPLCGRILRKELRHRGHSIVGIKKADILILHSGAWLMMDEYPTDKRILLIDPAYQTTQSVLAKSVRRIQYDIRHLRPLQYPGYLLRRSYNLWYFITKLPYWIEMLENYRSKDISSLLRQKHVHLFEASDPAWHDTVVTNRTANVIVELPGDHDALWHTPRLTADILGL